MISKGPDAYRTIGEASEEVGVPSYVLRFWETKFKQIRPVKRLGGRRFYRPDDIKILMIIKTLLHKDGLTIKGAIEHLKKINLSEISSLSHNLFLNRENQVESDHYKEDIKIILDDLNKIHSILT